MRALKASRTLPKPRGNSSSVGDASPSDSIVREVRIRAPRDAVFTYFVDPVKMVAWKARAAWLEPRPGGLFRVEVNDRNTARGQFLEIEPPRRIVFTWGWEGADDMPPGSTRVEVTLEPHGDETVVRLVHSGILDALRPSNAAGWNHYLPRLQRAAAGRDPGPDPWASGMVNP